MTVSRQFVLWSVVNLFMMFFFQVYFTLQHEQAHYQVCRYFGGVSDGIHLSLVPGESSYINCTVESSGSYWEAQSNVDAVGYQLQVLLLGMQTSIYFFGMLLILVTGGKSR